MRSLDLILFAGKIKLLFFVSWDPFPSPIALLDYFFATLFISTPGFVIISSSRSLSLSLIIAVPSDRKISHIFFTGSKGSSRDNSFDWDSYGSNSCKQGKLKPCFTITDVYIYYYFQCDILRKLRTNMLILNATGYKNTITRAYLIISFIPIIVISDVCCMLGQLLGSGVFPPLLLQWLHTHASRSRRGA